MMDNYHVRFESSKKSFIKTCIRLTLLYLHKALCYGSYKTHRVLFYQWELLYFSNSYSVHGYTNTSPKSIYNIFIIKLIIIFLQPDKW